MRRTDAVIDKLNELLEKAGEETGAGTRQLRNQGFEQKITGRTAPLPAGGDYDHEAVMCHDGKIFFHLRWSEDGQRLEMTQDQNPKTFEGNDGVALLTRLTMRRGDTTRLDLSLQGAIEESQLPDLNGAGLTERTQAERLANGELRVRTTAQRYAERPKVGEFKGDVYVTGRITQDQATGVSDTVFVGYHRTFTRLCPQLFDEYVADLWHPDLQGPRFCVGRPACGGRFASVAAFAETAASLEEVGIIGAKDLQILAIETGLSCE